MSGMLGAGVLFALALAVTGCARDAEPAGAKARSTTLPPGVVARVAGADITTATVERIAREQHVAPDRALSLAVRDALFAAEASARGLAGPSSFGVRAALARAALHDVLHRADAAGPVTDDEVREATARHWLEIARPDAFRTVHAVVRVAPGADAAKRKKATEIADAIRKAVLPVGDMARQKPAPAAGPDGQPPPDPVVDAFERAANAVPHDGFEIVAQELDPVAADGRVVDASGARYDPDFARAAAALSARGDLSPPSTSAFGVHVVMLLEKLPGHELSLEERRALLRPEILADRARKADQALRAKLRASVRTELDVDALLAEVRVEP